MKRVIMILFMLILVGMFSVSVAEETLEEGTMVVSGVVEEDIDNDFLFNMYAESLFGYGAPSFYRANHDFSDDMQEFYDFLVTCIKEVAAGERISTEFTIEKTFTLTQEELNALVYALVYDYPYEMYWYDEYLGHTYVSFDEISTVFSFSVLDQYAAGEFIVDLAKTSAAKIAAENAKDIVDKYAAASDVQKLIGYKNDICELVAYDWDAYNDTMNGLEPDQNAWQLIYVFDGDTATNVVCEGYAKAFQYLCDMTAFDGDVYCYTVTGNMNGENHAWNLVHMSDGKVYLADITNVDSDNGNYINALFLAGYASGDMENGYVYQLFDNDSVSYLYDYLSRQLFSYEDLSLSDDSYFKDDGTEYISGDWHYILSGGEAKIIKYTGSDEEVIVPGVIDGFAVRVIGTGVFGDNRAIEKVIIGEGIRSLEQSSINGMNIKEIYLSSTVILNNHMPWYTWIWAPSLGKFEVSYDNQYMCSVDGVVYSKDMKTLINYPQNKTQQTFVVPDGIETIDWHAFAENYHLEKISLPDSIKTIGSWAFKNCKSLSDINMPEGCEVIGQHAFTQAPLTSFHIPSTLEYIGIYAFELTKISSITVDPQNTVYRVSDGILRTNNTLVYYLHGQSREVYTIPSDISVIQHSAIEDADKLRIVVIPDTVEKIWHHAFTKCENLRMIYLPYRLDSLLEEHDDYGELYILYFPRTCILAGEKGSVAERLVELSKDKVSQVDAWHFVEVGKEVVSGACGDDVTWEYDHRTGKLVLSGTGSTYDYEYGNGTNIKHSPWWQHTAFIEEIEINEGITHLGANLFRNMICTEISLPNTVAGIGEYVFAGCVRLDKVNLPEGLVSIGCGAFTDCVSLDELVFPETMTYIGKIGLSANDFFSYSSSVDFSKVTILCRECEIESDIFLSSVVIYGYYGSTAYQYAKENGYAFELIDGCIQHVVIPFAIEAGCETTGLSGGSFCDICNEIFSEPEIIPALGHDEGIWRIESWANFQTEGLKYRRCTRCNVLLEKEIIPVMKETGVCGENAVWKYDLGTSVLTITGSGAMFDYDFGFNEVVNHAPWWGIRTEIEEVIIQEGITHIGASVFQDLDNVKRITMPNTIISIGETAFYRCKLLENLVLSNQLKYIGDGALIGCTGVEEITFPETIISLADIGLISAESLIKIVMLSKECEFPLGQIIPRDVEIHGYYGSTAHQYAVKNDYEFVPLDECLEHNIVSFSVEAGCETTGLSGGSYCDICNEVFEEPVIIPELGHAAGVWRMWTNATYEKEGLKKRQCPRCYFVYETATIPNMNESGCAEKGHSETIDAEISATCLSYGLTEGKHCSVCGDVLVTQEYIPEFDHHIRWCNENVCMYCGAGNVGDYYTHKNIVLDYDDVSHKEWCEECGAISTEGLHLRICTKNKCEICSAPYNGENVIHQEGNYIEDNGYHLYNCLVCGYTTEKQEHSRQCIMTVCDICGLPYTGDNFWHPYIFMSDTEGHWMKCLSCEHESEREEHRQLCDGTLCLDCGNYCVGGKLVHTNITSYATVLPTCLQSGLTEGELCNICGVTIYGLEEIPALGHSEVILEAVSATCTQTGLTEGKHCSVCGVATVKQEEIAALGHKEEIIPGKAATCTETGLTEGKKCSVCGEITVEQEEIAALGHKEEILPGKAATCTETGLTEGKKCTVCGVTTVEQEEIAALGHKEEIIPGKAATCTETGLTEGKKCTVCGVTTVAQEEIAALGHKEEIIPGKAATCTETGLTEGKKCTVCGVTTVEQEEIAALGHKEEIIPGKAVTCTEDGLTEGKKCTVCGETTVEQEEIAALGHKEEIIPGKAATCTETGLTEGKKCSVCGEITVEQEEIAALGHKEEILPGKAATCTEIGLTEGRKCSVCGEILKAQEAISALGHIEVVDAAIEANCTETGLTEGMHCSVCEEVLVAQTEVDALGHSEVIDETIAPTCTEIGLTEGVHCAVCNEIIKSQEEIPALGHDEGAWTIVTEATEEAEGLKELRCTVCETVLETEVIPKIESGDDERLIGDVSGDGIIDGRDLLRLAKYIGGFEVEIVLENASVNGDDVVDGRDLLRLAKYIGGFEVELE